MQPANNINELANNLIPGKFLTRDDANVYVPVYEELIRDIRDRVLHDQLPQQTIYASGQSGTGKTTALNFLPDDEIEERFSVVKVYANELFDLDDVDVIDILLMLSYSLMKQHPKLEVSFRAELEKIHKKHQGQLGEEVVRENGAEAEGGGRLELQLGNDPISRFFTLFRISTNFFASFRVDKKYRQITREAFSFNKFDLLNLTNRIIERHCELIAPNKDLLLIVNELDHIKRPELIRELFINNRYYLENLHCKKIVSVPAVLNTMDTFAERIYFFGLKLSPNKLSAPGGEALRQTAENRRLLSQVLYKRIHPDQHLIEPAAVELAVDSSGGIIRQFISILYYAATQVRRNKGACISGQDVADGCATVRQTLEGSIIFREKIEILDQIRRANKPDVPEDEMFMEMLQGNRILIYQNQPTWYEVNPLIADTVRIYAQQTET